MVEAAIDLSLSHTIGPRRLGDRAVMVSDATFAAAELGWKSKLSDLRTIVDTAFARRSKERA